MLKPELKTQFATGIINEPVHPVFTLLEYCNGLQLPARVREFSIDD
jgi:hypothetical protein